MFRTSDTIVAIATPPGRGGIGVVRVSGPDAHALARKLTTHRDQFTPRHATFTKIRLLGEQQSSRQSPRVKDRAAVGTVAPRHREGSSSISGGRSNGSISLTSPEAIDHVVATYFPGPRSYTGEDVMELSAHGSPVILRAIVGSAVAQGARLAEPGEFTLRAFLNGRIDLTQAEAVADLIDAVTPVQARAAFDQLQGTLTSRIGEIDSELFDLIARLEASIDFPDEGYHFIDTHETAGVISSLIARANEILAHARRGCLLREGLQIAIIGKPNVGKSSVFNVLVGASRAIVAALPGTTRDLLTETIDLAGLRVTLVDTAGIRETDEPVEIEGVERARRTQTVSDLTLIVLDGGAPLDATDRQILRETTGVRRLIIVNKADLEPAWSDETLVRVSARTGTGMESLRDALVAALDVEPSRDSPEITNIRHITLVQEAKEALNRALEAMQTAGGALPEEFVLVDLQLARTAFDQVVGRRTPDDVLNRIFSRFCVGK